MKTEVPTSMSILYNLSPKKSPNFCTNLKPDYGLASKYGGL